MARLTLDICDAGSQQEQKHQLQPGTLWSTSTCAPPIAVSPTTATVATLQSLGLGHGSRIEVEWRGMSAGQAEADCARAIWRRATVQLEQDDDLGDSVSQPRVDTMCYLDYDEEIVAESSLSLKVRMTSFYAQGNLCLDLDSSTAVARRWRWYKGEVPSRLARRTSSQAKEYDRERRKSAELSRLTAELAEAEARLAAATSARLDAVQASATAETPPPAEFICPITQEVMDDPVSTIDGHTYERDAIMRWLRKKKTSPMTGAALKSSTLVANIALRKLIEEYHAKQCSKK